MYKRQVYLSEVVDEAPRYADWSEAPSWLQEDVDYYSDPENKTPLPFLLRGADSPALRILFNPPDSGQHERATFPTSKAPISAMFHSFRLILGRAIISRNGLEAWTCFP